MRVTITRPTQLPKKTPVILGVFSDAKPSEPLASFRVPTVVRHALKNAKKAKSFTGELGTFFILPKISVNHPAYAVVGLGQRAEWSLRRARLVARRMARIAEEHRWRDVLIDVDALTAKIDPLLVTGQVAENLILGGYAFRKYQAVPPAGWFDVRQITLVAQTPAAINQIVAEANIVATAVNHARDLANTPGGHMTPTVLAQAAVETAKSSKLRCRVLSVAEMKKHRMGALLGIAAGSTETPKLIIMEYFGSTPNGKPLVYVGKGVTFDSGGLNLKPGSSMEEMHMDMAGGAAVIAAMSAIARLKLPVNVVGLVPAVENMPSGASVRPGDLLKSYNGKTIEIGNTDAEGRVILADALAYAEKTYHPAAMIDVATLTGAAVVALGQHAAGLFSPDDAFRTWGQDIGETSGDYCWPLPMWEEYAADVKGTFGDVTNSGKSRWGGAIDGAMFLKHFVTLKTWIHLDIAPTMSSVEGQHLAKGATGSGVRWLIEFARQWQARKSSL